MSEETVITAKLVRGKSYSINFNGNYEVFERSVPREVSAALADELETLTEVVTTSDGDEIEKDLFLINRNASVSAAKEGSEPKKLRMRIVPVEAKESKVKPAPARKLPPGRRTA